MTETECRQSVCVYDAVNDTCSGTGAGGSDSKFFHNVCETL